MTYLTNCVCPRCGSYLYSSDIDEYPFLCKECDENFYGMEVTSTPSKSYSEVTLHGISKSIFEENREKLHTATDNAKANFLGYDETACCIDVGWSDIPDAEQMQTITSVFDEIMKRKEMLLCRNG